VKTELKEVAKITRKFTTRSPIIGQCP
jgi:hypothetical protein